MISISALNHGNFSAIFSCYLFPLREMTLGLGLYGVFGVVKMSAFGKKKHADASYLLSGPVVTC